MNIAGWNMKYFNLAIIEATKSQMEHKIGCVAVYKKKVIASGYNYDGFVQIIGSKLRAHAEMCTIVKLLRRSAHKISINKVDIYIARVTPAGISISKPCKACTSVIQKLFIKNIYYTTEEIFIKEKGIALNTEHKSKCYRMIEAGLYKQ